MCIDRRFFLSALAAACWPAAAKPAPALQPMLALDAPDDIDPAGSLVSEKFDGVRALWDGERLRFRSGLPVPAPRWFTDALPRVALDGELWLARGQFDALSGSVRRAVPRDAEWRALSYRVFDWPGTDVPFVQRQRQLQALLGQTGVPWLQPVEQQALPSREALQLRLQQVLGAGGEGLMLHRAQALWRPGRSADLLKLKPLADAEAMVVGHLRGRGRHAGRLGALRVRTADGLEFRLGSGFSDAQREQPPAVGQWVTYRYRGYTEAGVPRFATFVRERHLP